MNTKNGLTPENGELGPGRRARYNGIDLVKFIMAICVIAIHTQPLEYCSNTAVIELYTNFVNSAVPFFFLASGYLLAVKLQWPYDSAQSIKEVQNYIIKAIKMYVFWSAVYFPLALYYYISSGKSALYALFHYLRGLLFVGEHYNSWMLWYLLSTIYAAVFVLICLKRHFSPNVIFALGVILLFISISLDAFVQFEGGLPALLQLAKNLVVLTIGNGRILRGSFYIPCGMLLANKKSDVRIHVIVFLAGFIMSCMISSSFVKSVLLAVYAVALFRTVSAIKLENLSFYPILRKMSTIMYFIHMYIWTFYYSLIYGEKRYGADSFLVTATVSIMISCGYIYMKDLRNSNKRTSCQ